METMSLFGHQQVQNSQRGKPLGFVQKTSAAPTDVSVKKSERKPKQKEKKKRKRTLFITF